VEGALAGGYFVDRIKKAEDRIALHLQRCNYYYVDCLTDHRHVLSSFCGTLVSAFVTLLTLTPTGRQNYRSEPHGGLATR
jgi:hypothetical protein